jgi:hypothetical protein
MKTNVRLKNNSANSTKTLVLISNCHAKTKDFSSAMAAIDKVIDITVGLLGENSQ